MSAVATAPIVCGGCASKFVWKPQLAGKRVKCKCGHVISVSAGPSGASTPRVAAPQATKQAVAAPPKPRPAPKPAARPEPVDDFDALAALAADADRAAAAIPVEIRDLPAEPVAVPATKKSGKSHPLAYQRGPTAADKRKGADFAAALVDPVRDMYVPVGLILVGLSLYVGFFGSRFHLNASALTIVSVVLSLVTLVKTALLVGAALVLAGPLGVSFGTLSTAIRKLAAIAVFSDGITAWVDHALSLAGGGVAGYSAIGWIVSVLIYWALMVYLFSMEVMDARLVVVCLGVFSRILRAIIVLCLMNGVLSMGGVSSSTAASSGFGGTTPSTVIHASALSAHVDDLKNADALIEGRKFIADGHQAACSKAVEGWYAAGCPKVWFEMSGRDINGRRSPQGLLVQLPDNPAQRVKAYDVLKQYDADMKLGGDPEDYKDTGESYLEAGLR